MIDLLRGVVDSITDDRVILDVNGVGYGVFAPSRVLAKLSPGQAARLHILTHVREDHIYLYGFADAAEKDLFVRLTETVSGVGAKVGMSLLSAFSVEELAAAIATGDVKGLTRADGVGKKLAERIVLEMKGKVTAGAATVVGGKVLKGAAPAGPLADVISALVNMGFKPAQAQAAVDDAVAQNGADAGFAQLLKASLQGLRA